MRLLLGSPVGPLLVEYDARGACALRFWPGAEPPPEGTRGEPDPGDPLGRQIARELNEYFAGARRTFAVPLRPVGTAFQRAVWEALLAIPAGETRSYGDVARVLGRPGASRAVGQANARNPLPILIPCHRVLAAGGGIGGYLSQWGDGTGTATKRWLLNHERSLGV